MQNFLDDIGIDSGVVIVILLILTIILLLNTVSNNMKITRLDKRYRLFMKGADGQSLEKEFTRKFNQIDRLFEAKEDHEKYGDEIALSLLGLPCEEFREKYNLTES